MPQQWLVNTTAPGVAAHDRRRLDFVIYGAAARRGPLLRCHLGTTNQKRWQPSSWSAGVRRGRTCHGSSPQACPLPGARPWWPAPLVCSRCRDGWTLRSVLCNASLPCEHTALPPRCAEQPCRAGQGAGGGLWRLLSSVRLAVLPQAYGRCPHCPLPMGISPSQRPSALQLARRPAGRRCGNGFAPCFGAPRRSAARVKHLSRVTRGGDRAHRCRRKKVWAKKKEVSIIFTFFLVIFHDSSLFFLLNDS